MRISVGLQIELQRPNPPEQIHVAVPHAAVAKVDKAAEMKNIARDIEDLLNDVSKKIDEINNVDTGIYQGNRKPAELKAELDEFEKKSNKPFYKTFFELQVLLFL